MTAGNDPVPPLELDDAIERILADAWRLEGTEAVPLQAARGRVLAEPLVAAVDVPGFDNSAMDGYALRAADLADDPRRALRVTRRILAGDRPGPLAAGEAARIFTGAPLPAGADTVIMQEECQCVDDLLHCHRPPVAGEYVRRRAHDFARGATLLDVGHRVRPQDVAVAAATGATTLAVVRRPRLALFSTGDELAAPGTPLAAYHRYSTNNALLATLAGGLGCEVTDAGIVADDPQATRRRIGELADGHDLVVTSGGASVGEADHVQQALRQVGDRRFWRIAVRPGKPVLFGRLPDALFLGLPGNPVSCFVTFLLLVRPLLLAMQGCHYQPPRRYRVEAGFRWPRAGQRREFVRARIEHDGDSEQVVLYPNQSSDVLSSTVWADGLVDIPAGTTIERGDAVSYLPFRGLLDD